MKFLRLAVILLVCHLQVCHSNQIDEINPRIVGGSDTVIRNSPYMVHLEITQAGKWRCGGALITRDLILTAARCVVLSDIPQIIVETSAVKIAVGDHEFEQAFYTSAASWIKAHHGYREHKIGQEIVGTENDIALVKSDRYFSKNKQNQRILSDIGMSGEPTSIGTACFISGWGLESEDSTQMPGHMKRATVHIKSWPECNTTYAEGPTRTPLSPSTVCAGVNSGGIGSCEGDYGGPLVCDLKVVGVFSYSHGCARKLFFGVYTDVHKYREWISENGTNSLASPIIAVTLIFTLVINLL